MYVAFFRKLKPYQPKSAEFMLDVSNCLVNCKKKREKDVSSLSMDISDSGKKTASNHRGFNILKHLAYYVRKLKVFSPKIQLKSFKFLCIHWTKVSEVL